MSQTTSSQPRHQADYDVIIIGAGIVGSMIARELCRYEGRFALLEKESFSGFGVSKDESLHAAFSLDVSDPGPCAPVFLTTAAARYQKLADELDVAFKTS